MKTTRYFFFFAFTFAIIGHAASKIFTSTTHMPSITGESVTALTPTAKSPLSSLQCASTKESETLPKLSFIVEVLTVLTTILVLVSGYTVYRTNKDAEEAKRSSNSTLIEAERALKDIRLTLKNCDEIGTELKTMHNQILKELSDKKISFALELEKIKADLTRKMEAELDLFRNNLHEATIINRTKTRLIELLAEEKKPTPDEIFPLLTDILNYPDQRSIEIYERLLDAFSDDEQIIAKGYL